MFFTPELMTRRDSGFGLLWYDFFDVTNSSLEAV
jgi:hypothetical protein